VGLESYGENGGNGDLTRIGVVQADRFSRPRSLVFPMHPALKRWMSVQDSRRIPTRHSQRPMSRKGGETWGTRHLRSIIATGAM
jgi:hypothetical protein